MGHDIHNNRFTYIVLKRNNHLNHLSSGFVTTYKGALLTRFFLGFSEAAFFPGALFLLSKWYTPSELGTRTAILTVGSLTSNAFGALIASVILDTMQGKLGRSAWRWLFYIEGSMTVIVALLAIFIVPDFPSSPSSLRFLTTMEARLAVHRMRPVEGLSSKPAGSSAMEGLSLAFRDPKIYWLAVTLTSMVVSLSFNAFFPTLTQTLGYGTTVTLLLCAPPWAFATAIAFIVSRCASTSSIF